MVAILNATDMDTLTNVKKKKREEHSVLLIRCVCTKDVTRKLNVCS
jgi:hypothetical protein